MIQPWAQATAWRMLTDVSRRDLAGWHGLGREINVGLRRHVEAVDISDQIRQMYDYQIAKILELPDDASQQMRESREISANIVAQLRGQTIEGEVAGKRWREIVDHVNDTGLRIQSSANTVAGPKRPMPPASSKRSEPKASAVTALSGGP